MHYFLLDDFYPQDNSVSYSHFTNEQFHFTNEQLRSKKIKQLSHITKQESQD